MMKSVKDADNPLISRAYPAMERAAARARTIAMQTGTAIVVMRNEKMTHIWFNLDGTERDTPPPRKTQP